jgi:uncharacterized pyridoxamine 5'-phosphate oxidase family protein
MSLRRRTFLFLRLNFFLCGIIFNFVIMTTLTVNIDDKKAEKAVKAVLEALDLDYSVTQSTKTLARSLNKSEQAIFTSLKKSVEEIKLYKEGKIQLQNARDLLNEL